MIDLFEMLSYLQSKNNLVTNKWVTSYIWKCSLNLLEPSIVFYIETSHLICTANQIIGSYMKCNTGLKTVKGFRNGSDLKKQKNAF